MTPRSIDQFHASERCLHILVAMENPVLDKESPIPTIDLNIERPITFSLGNFASNDGRVQVHVKDLQIDPAVKFLFAQQSPAGDIHFITQPTSQNPGIDANQIQLATLQNELQPTTSETATIQIGQNKDDIFHNFQIQDKIQPELLDLRNVQSKPIEDEQRIKFIARKLKNIKTNIDELYKKAGITSIALTALDGNVHFTGPEHLETLQENGVLKTLFLNAVVDHETNLDVLRKSSRKKPERKGKAMVQQWACDECSYTFATEHNLINHKLLSHSQLPVHKCEICSKEFVDKTILQRHLTTHTDTISFQCKICGNSFAAKNLLNSHMKIHNGAKPYSCKICSKSFNSASSLQYHTNKHTGSKKCVCKHCNKEFTKMSSLKVHMRIHSGEQPYRCQECGKGFVVSTHLTRHLRVHSGERPYLCEICGKRFNRSSHLRIHYRIHSGEKPYECEICGKRFNQTVTRKKHLKTHANGN